MLSVTRMRFTSLTLRRCQTVGHMHSYQSVKKLGALAIIRCPFDGCNTRIIKLSPALAATETEIANAPQMAKPLLRFFKVNDVWDFDNIGVSRPAAVGDAVDDLVKVERLLICGECDKGPLGFAGFVDASDSHHLKLHYYLACDSVSYE